MVIFQGSTFRFRGCAFGLAVYSWYPRLNSLYYRQTLTEKFIIASVCLFFFIVVTRTLSVIFQWVLAIVGVQYDSSIAWHNHLNWRRSNARNFSLRNSLRVRRPIYLVNSFHNNKFSIWIYFKSLHKLKIVRNLPFISYNFFFHSIRCLNFSIDLKIQAGLSGRRTFRLVTHSSPTIVCVGGMLCLGRKKHNVIRKKENITDFLDPIFQSFTIS